MPENVDVHAMNFGELETEVLKKLWITVSEDSDGFAPVTAYNKYSKYRIDKKINQAYSEMVANARALKSWFIITLKNGYAQYPVPLKCFDIESVFYFSSATQYEKFDVYDITQIDEELLPGWRTTPSTPEYAYVADRNKMVIKLGVAPAPNFDGTAITLASGVSSLTQPYGTGDAVSGAASPASATITYVDSDGQDFVALGVIPGLTMMNISDGSTGVISTVTGSTIVCTAGFTGGERQPMDPRRPDADCRRRSRELYRDRRC